MFETKRDCTNCRFYKDDNTGNSPCDPSLCIPRGYAHWCPLKYVKDEYHVKDTPKAVTEVSDNVSTNVYVNEYMASKHTTEQLKQADTKLVSDTAPNTKPVSNTDPVPNTEQTLKTTPFKQPYTCFQCVWCEPVYSSILSLTGDRRIMCYVCIRDKDLVMVDRSDYVCDMFNKDT